MAYLSYQLIIHYKELQQTEHEIILSMDVKHIHDLHYQPVVLTTQKDVHFPTASRPAFLHLFENFHDKIQPPALTHKRKSSVAFDERVQVRIILEGQNYDYTCLIP